MCTFRKPADTTAAAESLATIAAALASPELSIETLKSLARFARASTRIVRRIDVVNSDAAAVVRCAVPREADEP